MASITTGNGMSGALNVTDIAPGLTRVQSLDPEDDDSGGLALATTASGGVLVRWDGGDDVWTTAEHLCREGDKPEPEEPTARQVELAAQRAFDRLCGG